MSKYTEAIESLTCHGMALRYNPCDDEEEAKDRLEIMSSLKLAIEALQIADKVRFEVEWLIDCEIANNGFLKASDAETFAKSIVDFVLAQNEESGKRLADIRGDNNGD